MTSSIVPFLRTQPVLVLFLLLGCGYLLGRIKIAGFAFGPVAGTLLIAIVLGHFGFRMAPGAQMVGFALYIFSVGYQAGPRFVGVVKTHGLRYLALAVLVIAAALGCAWLAGTVLGLPLEAKAGLFAGSLTSSAALAAAHDAVRSGLATLPPATTIESALASISTSYAITYVVGTLCTVAIVSLFPRIIGLDLEAAARRLEKSTEPDSSEPLQARAYRVENQEFCRATVDELRERLWDGLAVVRVRRALAWLPPGSGEHLQIGDEIYAYGSAQFFRGGIDRVGPEIRILNEMELSASQTHVVIARKGAVGKTLRELDLARGYGLVVCDVKRDGYPLPVTPDLAMQRGDVLTVVGPLRGIKALPGTLGPIEPNPIETDMTTFVFGVAFGAAVGLLSITVADIPITLGMSGGLLLTGILVGWLNSARPTIGRFPGAARWLLMEFGLLIFIAGVGLNGGGAVVETLHHSGLILIPAATVIVSVPFAFGYAFGRKVLKLEPVVLLGALTGALTSAAALTLVIRQAQSAVPTLGYTGTYAFASVLMALAGTLIVHV